MIDLSTYTDNQIEELRMAVAAEKERRIVLSTAPEQIAALQDRYTAALGRVAGGEWAQPVTLLGAYRLGDQVTHNGKVWKSLIPNNQQVPGDPDDPQWWRWWRNLTDMPYTNNWQPNGKVYQVNDQVNYHANVFRVKVAHVSQPAWDPESMPTLFAMITLP